MTQQLSFQGDNTFKSDLLAEIKEHERLDQIVQGHYGKQNGKWTGCGVGCAIHSLNKIKGTKFKYDNHSALSAAIGVPVILYKLHDRIFEGLPQEQAKTFPLRFTEAIPVGKDLDSVWRKFLIWLLVDSAEGVVKYAKNEHTKKAITDVADLLERSLTEKITAEQFREVRKAAAADAADAADAYAADAAAAADAAYAAYYAAYYAADAAAAAYAADAAAAAYAADAAADARKGKYVKMAEKLIELLKAA